MPKVTVEEAIALLNKEEVVALPTETVYGLAGKFDSVRAIEKIFSTKNRPFFDPLIVHVSNWAQIPLVTTEWSSNLQCLADSFWPGPLTLILKRTAKVSDLASSGLDTVGVRWPNHAIFQKIIAAVGPLAAPSANMFGKTSPTSAQHVVQEFKDQVAVVDGGDCDVGIESTVLRPTFAERSLKIEIFRPGQITAEQIEVWAKTHGFQLSLDYVSSKSSPGHTPEHYQPSKPLFLIREPRDLQRLSTSPYPHLVQARGFELRLPSEPYLAARALYAEFRRASEDLKTQFIYLLAPDEFETEAWRAIRDRVLRAIKLDLRQAP